VREVSVINQAIVKTHIAAEVYRGSGSNIAKWLPLRHQMRTLLTAAALLLNWRTNHRTVRAKDTTITDLRAEQRLAMRALVIVLACVGGHGFQSHRPAARTGQQGFQNDGAHGFATFPSSLPTSRMIHRPAVGSTQVPAAARLPSGKPHLLAVCQRQPISRVMADDHASGRQVYSDPYGN
jgi:hypothetical protein